MARKAGNSQNDDVSVDLGIWVRQQKEKRSGKTNGIGEQDEEDICDRHT
jgi:hypothetical protein